jgi:chemotaxis protein methyltransferase CheR
MEISGIALSKGKEYLIETRLNPLMEQLGCTSYSDLHKKAKFDPKKDIEKKIIDAISTNETYFFRDFPQLQGFAEKVLPLYLEKKKKAGNIKLKVWSAACSTGEEAYTLSIILQEMIDDYQKWNTEIQATDLDRKVLAHAMNGLYGERSMKETPIPYRTKYFLPKGDQWQISKKIKDSINFLQLNFVDRLAMRSMHGFDFVFCRNVLIYFDDESRKKVINSLYDSLVPGGYLFLGHSESIGRITAAFELQSVDGFLCYRRPI